MAELIKKNSLFFILFTVFILIISPFLMIFTKSEIHLFLNRFHSSFLDLFFKTITYLGDGAIMIIIGIILAFFSFRKSFYIIATYLGTGMVVQILKRLVFSDMLRPVKFFGDNADLYLVEGVKLYSNNSFPSGHATSAFGLFVCLVLITSSKSWQLIFAILAILTAYSRVYLSQHFLIDIYTGSIIGTLGALFFYRYLYCLNKKWPDKSLFTIIRFRL